MKSKITIDLDIDNQPIVKIDFQPSDDVRDKMVKRFLETFGHSSVWCRWEYQNQVEDGSTSILRPISPERLIQEGKEILSIGKIVKV
jgi:hypothetical protein